MSIKISVVVPVYNEEENLPILYRELRETLKKMKKSYEIIFIDDGSSDSSLEKMKRIKRRDKNVKIIQFYRNFGQTAALSAGFDHSKGNIIISMDSDLQNDPKDIPKLIKKMNEYDLVTGWRKNRKDGFSKKILSKFANFLRRRLLNEFIHDAGCTLKAYKSHVVKDIKLYGEMHRYISSIANIRGFRVGEVETNHRERSHGKTKYGSKRLIKGFLDLIYIKYWSDYSNRPLHFFGYLSFVQYLISVLIFIYYIIKVLIIGNVYVGPLILLSAILLVTGSIFLMFGFLFEIQIRTYYEKNDLKPYNIKKII